MKRLCLLELLLLVVLVAAGACAEDAEQKSPPGDGMGAEPAMAAQQSPPGVGMERAIAQLQHEMQQAASAMKFEDAARLRDAINVLTQGAAADGPGPEQNELHEREKKWHEQEEARLRSQEKTVVFPFDLGRKPITVVPGHASVQWWDEVEAGLWEPETFKVLYQEVTADVSYVGVGEWCGVTGLFAGQRAKRTVLVEPDPVAHSELKMNVKLGMSRGGLRNIDIDTRCVSSPQHRGKVTMHGNGSSTSSLLPNIPWLEGAQTFEATCVTLEDLFEQYQLSGNVFIKMDIEGAEASVVPTLLIFLSGLETKPSLFISFHGQANPEQKGKIAEVFNLYTNFAVLKGHPHVDLDPADCRMGVSLTVNDGKTFNAENICDTCDVLLTDSRTRSELLCARKTPSSTIGELVDQLPTEDATPQRGGLDAIPQSGGFQDILDDLEHEEKLSVSGGRRSDRYSTRAISVSSLAESLEETIISSADNFTQLFGSLSELQLQVQQLEHQNDWSQVATPYVSCMIGMTWKEIGNILAEQDRNRPNIATGGLGRKMIPNKIEVWVCSRPDRCATSEEDFMCYVFDEQEHVFLPWGRNSELKIVKHGPFISQYESTAAIALAEVKSLEEEVYQVKKMNSMIFTGAQPTFAGPSIRKFSSEQNLTTNLWRETSAIYFVPNLYCSQGDTSTSTSNGTKITNTSIGTQGSNGSCTKYHQTDIKKINGGQYPFRSRTITFSHLLLADKGGSTCFGVKNIARNDPYYQTPLELTMPIAVDVLRFTAIDTKYEGVARNELGFSAISPDFCLGSRIRVSNLQHVADRFQISNFGHSPFVPEPLDLPMNWQSFLGSGYQPLAISLSDSRGTLFVNFHAGQNYNYDPTQRHLMLWGAADLTKEWHKLTDYMGFGFTVSSSFRRGDFQEISAVPLLKGYLSSNRKPTCFCVPGSVVPGYPYNSNSQCSPTWTPLGYQTFTCKTTTDCSEDYYTCEPVYAFGRVHVGAAQSGQYVWFAGGLEVTGDGPQGNVIFYDQQDNPEKPRPALRPMNEVKVLNVVNGRWLSGQLSSARFGVAGAGANRFVFFAGGAQLTQDGNIVVNELQWQVNTSSCVETVSYVYGWAQASKSKCRALPLQKTLINSNVVEIFDMQEMLSASTIINSKSQITLSSARRFAAGASIPSLNIVLFAGGVTASADTLPQGGWLPSQTSSAVDIYTITGSDATVSRSTKTIVAGKMVAGSADNLIVLIRHHENAVFDNKGHIFDGSAWTETSHPGRCGVQDSTASYTASTANRLLFFLSACDPEALVFNLITRTWLRHQFTHSTSPARVVAILGEKILFAGGKEPDPCPIPGWTGVAYNNMGMPVSTPVQSLNLPLNNTCSWYGPLPPTKSNGECGWDGLGSWRSASCGGNAGMYKVPPGFVKGSVEISSLTNPSMPPITRTIAFPAHIPEVDVGLSLPNLANTSHLATDSWIFTCKARVNGKSTSAVILNNNDEVCITPHGEYDDEFVTYQGGVYVGQVDSGLTQSFN